MRFAHDLLADWVRLKPLMESRLPDSTAVVKRAAGVGWFRAVRLHAQRLLEQSADGVEQWRRCVASLEAGESERLARQRPRRTPRSGPNGVGGCELVAAVSSDDAPELAWASHFVQ